jgi:bifunctional DNA-binding transcriptional regulator/antitoxin component of YhaV-PrlF toxin-antitoxin module
MQSPEEHAHMALVRLKKAAQITLPVELRKQFHPEEGDYLKAQAVEEGILLKPVSVMGREEARRELRALLDRVDVKLPPIDKTPREQEEEITRIIKELRREDAAARRA